MHLKTRAFMRAFKNLRYLFVFPTILVLCGCVITTVQPVFETADFTRVSAIVGDWQEVPEEAAADGSAGEPPAVIRISPIDERRYLLVSLDGGVASDKASDRLAAGLVALGQRRFILVVREDDEEPLYEYIGLTLAGDELAVHLFGGGDSPEGEAAFAGALDRAGLVRDPAFKYQVRLMAPGERAMKTVFRELLSDPATFGGETTRYRRVKP